MGQTDLHYSSKRKHTDSILRGSSRIQETAASHAEIKQKVLRSEFSQSVHAGEGWTSELGLQKPPYPPFIYFCEFQVVYCKDHGTHLRSQLFIIQNGQLSFIEPGDSICDYLVFIICTSEIHFPGSKDLQLVTISERAAVTASPPFTSLNTGDRDSLY